MNQSVVCGYILEARPPPGWGRARHRSGLVSLFGIWREIAALLTQHGDGGLTAAIRQEVDGRRIGDNAAIALTTDDQTSVDAVLHDWLGENDPN